MMMGDLSLKNGSFGKGIVGVLAAALVFLIIPVSLATLGMHVLELAMADRAGARLRATEAAEAGIAAALRAREWSAAGPWTFAGALPAAGEWRVEVRLAAARADALSGEVEWLFEIESIGRAGAAVAVLRQDFAVTGPLPGTARRRGWHVVEPVP